MSLIDRRRKVAAAETRLRVERMRWRNSTEVVRNRFAAHRNAFIVGGGLIAGVVASLMPLRPFARAGGLLVGVASFILRSPLSALLFDGVVRHGSAAAAAAAAPSSTAES